jgi:Glycosyltransferase family 87
MSDGTGSMRHSDRTRPGGWQLQEWLVVTPGLLAASCIAILLAYAQKLPCSTGAWKTLRGSYSHLCYTDIHSLYFSEGLVKGTVPYLGHAVEYPVGIGITMQVVASLVRGVGGPHARAAAFYYLTAALLAVFLAVTVFATARLAGPERRRDALLVALSPVVIFSAFTNWDLIAVGLAMVGLVAWAAGRPIVAGVLIGAATATKFYPLLFFGPLLLLCWRAGRLRQFTLALAGGVASWLVMNLPFIIAAPSNWARFYVFSRIRGASYGTVWLFFQQVRVPVAGTLHVGTQNLMSAGLFAACCIVIAVLAMAAPRRPRLPQLLFLVVAAFLLTGKVWSPQYVLWLAPLAVLARPKLGAYLVWQACEIAYWLAVKLALLHVYDLTGGLPAGKPGFAAIGMPWYYAALVARAASVLLFAVLVARDIMRPEGDVVRAAGADDPAGGALAGAPDAVRLRRGSALPVRLRSETVVHR